VQIDISTDLGEVSTIAGKATELREVLLNVIFNAMDAMPEGGSITIRTAQEDSWVVLSISDTGVGMTKEVQRKIFDPFFTTKGSQGSGLGLSTSLGIVAKHGGTVEVDSTLENGSTFRIRLPILTGTRGEGRGNNDSHATKSARILAVDDEPEVAEVLELMLRQLGYEATVVNNGQEALDAFFSGGYDLVISDVYMPGMSGQEVARAIKESTADVPVLLITGWALQIDALEVNVDGLIAKPFSKEILSHHITKVLDGKREG
jgi:CheY-like chemotaxis protein